MSILNNPQELPTAPHSHKLVTVACDFELSDRCYKVYEREFRDVIKYRQNNNGKDICLVCSRKLKFSGRNNPNTKYMLSDTLFSNITTKEQAYLLGLIAAKGSITKSSICIEMEDAETLLTDVSKHISCSPVKYRTFRSLCSISLNSTQLVADVLRNLGLDKSGAKSSLIQFPLTTIPKELYSSFILGFFDGDGCITFTEDAYNYPRCLITSNSVSFLQSILTLYPNGSLSKTRKCAMLEYAGSNCIDFLVSLYTNKPLFYLPRKYELYQKACAWLPTIKNSGTTFDTFKCVKTDINAVLPTKANGSDSGYDLTIIKVHSVKEDVILYDTGLKIQPPNGWWMALVPRSSISKTGYMLANSIGIIDRTYTGPVLVALRKINTAAEDLKLPCKIAQLVPFPAVHFELEEVPSLEATSRNDGGFGSSDKK